MISRVLATCLAGLFLARASAAEWIKFPEYERTVLPNGATLLLMERHHTPLVTLGLALRSGSTQDPDGRAGLAEVTNDLLRKGAGARGAGEIAEALDFIGANLETSTGLEMTRVQLDFLAKDISAGLELFADLILRPKFPAEEVDKLVNQKMDEIKASKDQPMEVIGEYFKQALFGEHPYGRPPSGDERSLPLLKAEEIRRFHHNTYLSSNLVLIAVGDFKTPEIRTRLTGLFGPMPPKQIEPRPVVRPQSVSGSRLLLVDKPDATQTFFAIGNTGIALQDPDRLAVQLANTLFGGRFTSRLNTALRIDSGLSYGARSLFNPARYPGDFQIFSYTKNESTAQALDLALDVLEALHRDGFSSAEVDSGKAYLKGQFGPTLETSTQLAARLAQCEVFGFDPRREIDQYAARLDALTVEEVRRAIHRAFPSTNRIFTVIGKAEEIQPLLKKYSPEAKTIAITQPGFGE